jgi:hypothetical protein
LNAIVTAFETPFDDAPRLLAHKSEILLQRVFTPHGWNLGERTYSAVSVTPVRFRATPWMIFRIFVLLDVYLYLARDTNLEIAGNFSTIWEPGLPKPGEIQIAGVGFAWCR